MASEPRYFNDVERDFKSWLAERGLPNELLWVFREDVALHKGVVEIRTPLPSNNRALARNLFYHAQHRALGMKFVAKAHVDGHSVCHILAPQDEYDADCYLLSGNVQLVHVTPLPRGRTVRPGLRWWWHKRSSDRWLGYLPSRSAVREIEITQLHLPPTPRRLLFVVQDFVEIRGRGAYLFPGVDTNEGSPHHGIEIVFKIGDPVELRRPDGSIKCARIRGYGGATCLHNGKRQRFAPLTFDEPLTAADAPVGTEVWVAGLQKSS